MKTLIVIDAQNEFSEKGHRSVPGHAQPCPPFIDTTRN